MDKGFTMRWHNTSKTAAKWPRRLGNKGFSLVELVAAVAVLGLLVGIATPSFLTMMRRSQVDAATRHILSDVNRARSLAITTGWEYRVFGYNSDAASPFANQYRFLARANSGIDWTLFEAAAPFQNATQIAGQWVNLNNEYPGALINPGDTGGQARFWVAFNARGVRIELDTSFNPLNVSSDSVGAVTNSLNVSLPGTVMIQ